MRPNKRRNRYYDDQSYNGSNYNSSYNNHNNSHHSSASSYYGRGYSDTARGTSNSNSANNATNSGRGYNQNRNASYRNDMNDYHNRNTNSNRQQNYRHDKDDRNNTTNQHHRSWDGNQNHSNHMGTNPTPFTARNHDSGASCTFAAEEERLKAVNKETWDQYSLTDQIKSQYQYLETYPVNFYEQNIFLDNEAKKEKKDEAAKYAASKVIELMELHAAPTQNIVTENYTNGKKTTTTIEYSSSDDDDSYMKDVCATREEAEAGAHSSHNKSLPYSPTQVHQFFDSLKYNLLFNLGFEIKIIRPGDDKNCYCPCSKSMKKWRQNFNVDFLLESDECEGYHRLCEPMGLMSHIRKLGGGDGNGGRVYLHRGVELYLEYFYREWWGKTKTGEPIGHKALYHVNDANYKRSEAKESEWTSIEYAKLQKVNDSLMQELKLQDIELEKERKRSELLKQVSDKLSEQYEIQKKNFKVLELELKPKKELDEKKMKKCRELTRAFVESKKCDLRVRDPTYLKQIKNPPKNPENVKDREKVVIKLPYNFVLQRFFDTQCEQDSKASQSTFLFRDLDEKKIKFDVDMSKNYYYYKVLLDWDIKYDAAIKGNRRSNARFLKDFQAVDEGGPTSQFISDVCLQLSSLSVMLPIGKDTPGTFEKIVLDLSRKELNLADFLRPVVGCEVDFQGTICTVMLYDDKKSQATLVKSDGEQIPHVDRYQFVITKVPIKLFEEFPCGIFPQRDDSFENSFEFYRKVSPKMTKEDVEEKARLYLRAVGRFLLHVIVDGKNPIPSTILPEMLRNVVLRDCAPGSSDYDKADIMKHLAQLHVKEFDDIEKTYLNHRFEDFGIEEEGEITKDNFLTEFVPRFFVDPRQKNIDALRDGLTLNGKCPIDTVLSFQPLEAINQQFFSSNDSILCQDVIDLLQPLYEGDPPVGPMFENHQMFVSNTFPEALRFLSEKDSEFLVNFIFFATGSRCIPQHQGIPSFKLQVLFDCELSNESLPSSHTCENLIHVPWQVYNNDGELLMNKLEQAVIYGSKAGFDMA